MCISKEQASDFSSEKDRQAAEERNGKHHPGINYSPNCFQSASEHQRWVGVPRGVGGDRMNDRKLAFVSAKWNGCPVQRQFRPP